MKEFHVMYQVSARILAADEKDAIEIARNAARKAEIATAEALAAEGPQHQTIAKPRADVIEVRGDEFTLTYNAPVIERMANQVESASESDIEGEEVPA